MKLCKECGIEKNLEDFYKRSDSPDGYRNDCKDCVKKRRKNYRQSNPDKIYEYNKQYQEDNVEKRKKWNKKYHSLNKEKRNIQTLEWYYENKEHCLSVKKLYRKNNKKRLQEYHKKYKKQNSDLVRLYTEKRRALKISSEDGTVTKEAILNLLKQQNYKCVYCQEKFKEMIKVGSRNRIGYDMEHKTPLSRGGKHSINNIQLTCPACNGNKFDKTHEEFLTKEI